MQIDVIFFAALLAGIVLFLLWLWFSHGSLNLPVSGMKKRVLDLSKDGVIISNRQGRVIFVNKAAERMLGQTSSQIQDADITTIHHELGVEVKSALKSQVSTSSLLLLNNMKVYAKVFAGKSAREWWKYHGFSFEKRCVVELEDVNEYIYTRRVWSESERELHNLVYSDHLTGALNRRYFDHKMQDILKSALAQNYSVSLLMLDVDHLKEINDNYGHQSGDELLKKIVLVMKTNSRERDFVYRLSGDEFALMIINVTASAAIERAGKISSEVERISEDKAVKVSVSIGIAFSPSHSQNINQLLQFADKALYRAKADGRACIRVFDPEIDTITSVLDLQGAQGNTT